MYHACVHAHTLQWCLTLCSPIDCSPPSSPVLGILQARILEWVAMPSSRWSSQSKDQTCISYISCIGMGFLFLFLFFYPLIPVGKPLNRSFSSVQSLSRVRLFAILWIAACQASLSITNSWSSPKLMSVESVMPSSHLIFCHPLPLLPSVFPSTRGFSSKSVLCIRWPKYCSFSFSISSSNEYSGLISFRIDWFPLGLNGLIS